MAQAKDTNINGRAQQLAAYIQSLTRTMISLGLPHKEIHTGTHIQTPTMIGNITATGTTVTSNRKAGTLDALHNMKVQRVGFILPRRHQFPVP